MPVSPKALTISVDQGGRLVTARSLDGVGLYNWAEKTNFRRQDEKEVRREGWALYRANDELPQGVQATPSGGDRMYLYAECVRPNQERALFGASRTKIYKYDFDTATWIVAFTGLSVTGRRWQCIPLNGYLVLNNAVDLPLTVRAEENVAYPIYELRENGIASVGIIEELNGIIQCYDVTEIQEEHLNDFMNGMDPWGLVDPAICNRISFRCIWGEIGQPRNWAPRFDVSQPASALTITLPFASTAFVANVTRVGVVNAGPNGGMLGGQTGYEEGILVTAVAGNVITLEIPTNAALSYPRDIEVTRWSDLSTIAGRHDLQDDASEIIWAKKMNYRMMIYRKSGMFKSTYVGNVAQVFSFSRIVGTKNIPLWGEAIADVNGEEHIYPGEGNRFYTFDGTNEPTIHKATDDARLLLFNGVTPVSDVFAVDNPTTKEIWFCRPGSVFAYDYEKDTTGTIDAEIHAATYIQKPGSTDRWFILGIEGTLFTYGRVQFAEDEFRIITYLRNGVSPGGKLKSGLIFWTDRYNEKDLTEHVIHLGSGTQPPALRLKLYGTYDERVAPALLLTEDYAGPTYMVTCFYRAIFFQDEIIITEAGDIDIQVTARTFDRAPVRTQSIPRVTNAP